MIFLFEIYLADFPNFGIWQKMEQAFSCLEPWVGYSDTLPREHEGIQISVEPIHKRVLFWITIL
jgi:galactose mutarotase-like enzyme